MYLDGLFNVNIRKPIMSYFVNQSTALNASVPSENNGRAKAVSQRLGGQIKQLVQD